MRFLIGLIFGAGLIFVAVAVLGPGIPDRTGRLPAWVDGVAVRLGDWLALPPRPAVPAGERLQRLPARELASRDPAVRSDAAPDGDAAAEQPAAREPIPRPPDPRPLDQVADGEAIPRDETSRDEDVQALVAEIFGARDAVPDGQRPAPSTRADRTDERAAGEEVAQSAQSAAAAVGVSGSQAVWVPFHSRMSATGFASRLTDSLGHPFDVERQGPGRYQVVFAYADESERAALLEEAAAVTGLPL
jgi:hypothetical protein